MPFRVLKVGGSATDFAYELHSNNIAEFETADEAKEFSKILSREYPDTKWRIKRVVDMKWRSREQAKFDQGTYEALPWSGQPWWYDAKAQAVHNLQFAHPSRKEPGMIAFTASPEQGMDNKRTRIKPGRYLEQYFKDVLNVYRVSIRRLTDDFSRLYEPRTILYAETDEDIEWVYEHGPHSCMSSVKYRAERGWGWPTAGHWPLDTHACTVYNAGDLKVAYLTEDDTPKGRVVARSVVWPAKLTRSRVYGDEVRLKNALRTLGYKHATPVGAKVKRVPIPGETSLFLMPYIDAGDRSGIGSLAVVDKKTHFELSQPRPGTYPCNSTNGVNGRRLNQYMEPMEQAATHCRRCEHSVDDVPDGNLSRVQRSGASGDYHLWCDDCREAHAYYCGATDRYYDATLVPRITMNNEEIWSDVGFRQYGFTCAGNGRNYPNSQRRVMANGKKWSSDYYEDHGFQCAYTGDHYPNDEMVQLSDGHKICKAVMASYGFTCDTCERPFMNSHKRGKVCVHCIEDAAHAAQNTPVSPEERV